jgi:hypothetical protein
MDAKKAARAKKNQNDKKEVDIYQIQENANHTVKYLYTSLVNLKEQGEYNFYAVILDSTFPLEETNSKKYSCTLKLIDQTTNCLTNPNDFNDTIIYLTIKSSEKENIPYIHHIGDIIRVHRGFYSPKNKRNVYLNVCKDNKIKGSWCLYSLNNNTTDPYACSNKKFIVESQDKQIIEDNKTWVKNYLNKDKALIYPYQIKLESRLNGGNDNDLLVHVVKKVELDDQLVFFIQDETDGCELHTYKYFDFIKENDVIRVRSYKVFNSDVLVLNEFGNILKVPTYSDCYKTFMNNLSKKLRDYSKK